MWKTICKEAMKYTTFYVDKIVVQYWPIENMIRYVIENKVLSSLLEVKESLEVWSDTSISAD